MGSPNVDSQLWFSSTITNTCLTFGSLNGLLFAACAGAAAATQQLSATSTVIVARLMASAPFRPARAVR